MVAGGHDLAELKRSLLNISEDLLIIMSKAKDKIKEACLKFMRNRIVFYY